MPAVDGQLKFSAAGERLLDPRREVPNHRGDTLPELSRGELRAGKRLRLDEGGENLRDHQVVDYQHLTAAPLSFWMMESPFRMPKLVPARRVNRE